MWKNLKNKTDAIQWKIIYSREKYMEKGGRGQSVKL